MTSARRRHLPRQLPLQTLAILAAIAEHGTLARAAEAVNLVPSAVSRRLQELEAVLGVTLLHRSPQSVRFTEAGTLLLARARRILKEIDGIHTDLTGLDHGTRGRVRLAASTFALFESLPDDIAHFRHDFPGIDIEFQSMSSKKVMAGLYAKQIDVGIFATANIPPGIEGTLYRQDRLTVLVPHNHTLATRAGLTLAELAEHPLIGPPAGTETEKVLRQHAKRSGLTLKTPMQVASLDDMVLMVQAGLGLCLVPSRVWARLGPFAKVVQLPLAEPWSLRKVFIGMLANTPERGPTQRLYRYLQQAGKPGTDPNGT